MISYDLCYPEKNAINLFDAEKIYKIDFWDSNNSTNFKLE